MLRGIVYASNGLTMSNLAVKKSLLIDSNAGMPTRANLGLLALDADRLSEENSVSKTGYAIVGTHGNKNRERSAEMTDPLERVTNTQQSRYSDGLNKIVAVIKSYLIDSDAEIAKEAEPERDRERLSDRTPKGDAIVRPSRNKNWMRLAEMTSPFARG